MWKCSRVGPGGRKGFGFRRPDQSPLAAKILISTRPALVSGSSEIGATEGVVGSAPTDQGKKWTVPFFEGLLPR
jgi:hypothetical protein